MTADPGGSHAVTVALAAAEDRIGDLLERTMAAHAVPGVAVGLWLRGQPLVLTRGVTSVAAPVGVDASTLFQIGSTTKTLVATVVMVLVEQSRLDLDTPVHSYVPELRLADPSALERVSLRVVLTHMAGHDGDLFENFGAGEDALSRACAAMDVLPQLAPVGELWSYSNAGFTIAGRAIESVTGLSFETACRELVLDPLGMSDSCFSAAEAITRRTAVGHRVDCGQAVITRPWELGRALAPAGGLAASIDDQLRYAAFHLGQGPPLLTGAALRLMQSPLVAAGGGRASACGLSWLLQPTPGLLAHGGETNGQMSSFALVPDKQFAIAVCTNGQAGGRLHGPIVKWALRQVAGVSPASREQVPADPGTAASLLGRYSSRHETFVVALDHGGGLVAGYEPTAAQISVLPEAQAVPPQPMELYSGGETRIAAGALTGARGEFLSDAAGQVSWLRILGRLHRREQA